jgi:hypothetical protein
MFQITPGFRGIRLYFLELLCDEVRMATETHQGAQHPPGEWIIRKRVGTG